MKSLMIPIIAVIGLTTSAALAGEKHKSNIEVVERCLDNEGEAAKGCYVVEGPRVYCPSQSQKAVADKCDAQGDSNRPKPIGRRS